MAGKKSKRQFKAEIKQLLDIITHSIYTSREIFLRELISNASDALDKTRFLTACGEKITDSDANLEIRLAINKDTGIITLTDSGIGMTKDELVENIGTIAHSGSAKFVESIKQGKGGDSDSLDSLIGRFGVGFYSVFMVADEVVLTTRSADPKANAMRWVSDGTGAYTLEELDEDLPRGTGIAIKLKDSAVEFMDQEILKEIIRRHSNFISFPILLGDERINTTPALWREPKFKITKEQYNEFYTFLTYDTSEPLEHLHIAVDAPVQFTSLLFIPDQSSEHFFHDPENYGLDLFVRRVLIDRSHKALLPQYLGFIRGLVDTEDLPLSISRETLQENLLVDKIRQTITKQTLTQLLKLAEDKLKYTQFWEQHGRVFKLGYTDFVHREQFSELLRFNSSVGESAKELTSLKEYINRIKPEQKHIYYASGSSREAIRLNPHLEMFSRNDVEVLFLYEPIDEFILENLGKYEDYTLTSVEKADMEELGALTSAEDKEKQTKEELPKDDQETFAAMLKAVQELLGEKVQEVRESKRLQDSAACLVSPDGALSSQMQKYMQAISKDTTPPVKIMELNKDHPLCRNLLKVYKNDKNDAFFATAVEQLYESSLLLEGYVQDPHQMVARVNKLLEQSSGWYTEIQKIN